MEQQQLPNSTLIIVLDVLAFLCCCFVGLGTIPSAIAFFMARKSEKIYTENPELYSNISQIKTSKIIAIIALVINLYFLGQLIYGISTVGWDEIQEEFMRSYQEGLESQGQ